MKRLVVMLSLGVVVAGLTACGSKEDTEKTIESTVVESTVSTEAVDESNEIVETDVVDESTEEVSEEISSQWSNEMTAVRQAVVDTLGENYWADMAITPDMLEAQYGLTADLYDDYMGETPMISANVDTLLIVKAKEGKVKDVEAVLTEYRETLVNNTMQYPMNVGKIQASEVKTFGDYVCFVQLGADVAEAGEDGDEAIIKYCQEQNQLVLGVIEEELTK